MASSELAAFGARISRVVSGDAMQAVTKAGGMAGKKAALDAASKDLGGDRAFSGMRRKAPLGAGFDVVDATTVSINFRPAGLWALADQGRRSSGVIVARKRKRALAGNGFGPVARSRYGRSRGLNTFDDAVRKSQTEVPKAAARQFGIEVSRAVRG